MRQQGLLPLEVLMMCSQQAVLLDGMFPIAGGGNPSLNEPRLS